MKINPTASIEVKENAFSVTVGDGFYEIYIDKKPVPGYMYNGQTKDFPVADGERECGVYSQGRWAAQKIHNFGKTEQPETISIPFEGIKFVCPCCEHEYIIQLGTFEK